MSDKIAFLLGSGISRPACFPSMDDITKKILSGEGIIRDELGIYNFWKSINTGFPNEYVPGVVTFLKRLKYEIDLYYIIETKRLTNYEDIYYVASQILDSEKSNYDNPVVKPFIDKIMPEIKNLMKGNELEIRKEWQLVELAKESTNYIQDIVWRMLNKEPEQLGHLNIIKEFCIDDKFSGIDIFTLNHDTLLEQCLSQSKDIKLDDLNDGFNLHQDNIRRWDPALFNSQSHRIRLIKLHGSINWFRYYPDGGGWIIGIPSKLDFCNKEESNDDFKLQINHRPIFLVGTFNKMLNYIEGIYSDLFFQFYNSLKSIDNLIIIGYGFGDKGINTKIIEWMYSNSDNKLFIIEPKLKELKSKARGAITNNWDNWITNGRLHTLEKGVEKTTKENILKLL